MATGQPRDWRGRWTSGGGFSGGNSTSIKGIRSGGGEIKVTRISHGKAVRPGRIGANLAVQRFGKTGTPINGNKNVRFVSRSHAVSRHLGGGPGLTPARAVGRAHSARVARRATAPKSGYIVQYPPKGF